MSDGLLKPRLYVVFIEHDPHPLNPWLPAGYPSTCTEINGVNKPPLVPHEIMTDEEKAAIQSELRVPFLLACHENNTGAKDIQQVELAMAHPSTTLEDVAQWVDEGGQPSLQRYNQWAHRRRGDRVIVDPRLVPVEDFVALQEKVREMDEILRVAGLK